MRASVISSRSTSVASSHPGRAAELGPQRCQLMERSNPRGITGGLAEALAGGDVFIGLSRPGALPPALAATMAPQAIVFARVNPVPEILPDEVPPNMASVFDRRIAPAVSWAVQETVERAGLSRLVESG